MDVTDEGKLTISVCSGCTELARLVVKLMLEISVITLVLRKHGLMKDREGS